MTPEKPVRNLSAEDLGIPLDHPAWSGGCLLCGEDDHEEPNCWIYDQYKEPQSPRD
jgi:hypothetical protein